MTREDMQAIINDMLEAERETMNVSDPVSPLKEELAADTWLEDRLREQEDNLKQQVYRAKIAEGEAAVARETNNAGVARMLGKMRREMYGFAAPFYAKAVRQEIASIEKRQQALVMQIEAHENGQIYADANTTSKSLRQHTEAPKGTSWKSLAWSVAAVLLTFVLVVVLSWIVLRLYRRQRAAAEGGAGA